MVRERRRIARLKAIIVPLVPLLSPTSLIYTLLILFYYVWSRVVSSGL